MITKSTWVDEVVKAFTSLGGKAYLNEIYTYIEKNSSKDLTETYKATVRATLERNSSDSEAFSTGNDLFYIVDSKGKGHWGLRK